MLYRIIRDSEGNEINLDNKLNFSKDFDFKGLLHRTDESHYHKGKP